MILPEKDRLLFPEQWVQICSITIFSDISPTYFISNYGRIYNDKTGNFIPKNIYYDKDKYINITLTKNDGTKRQEMMQRLVMYCFNYIPGCENLEVNHKDGVKYHNWIWNLEWTTHQENITHAWDNKLFKIGEDKTNSKLTNKEIENICLLLEQGIRPSQIQKMYNNPNVNIERIAYNILNGVSWRHISYMYNIDNARRNKVIGPTTIENNIISPIEFI